MSEPIDDPAAALWPQEPAAQAAAEPRHWVWAAMEPAERRKRLAELAVWIDWLRVTFELHNQIPACWYRHPPVVEHLTALYIGWVRTYAAPEEPARELAEADWIQTLGSFTPRLQLAACAVGRHTSPPAALDPPPSAAKDFAAYLTASHETTAPAQHPAEAEMARLALTVDPPL